MWTVTITCDVSPIFRVLTQPVIWINGNMKPPWKLLPWQHTLLQEPQGHKIRRGKSNNISMNKRIIVLKPLCVYLALGLIQMASNGLFTAVNKIKTWTIWIWSNVNGKTQWTSLLWQHTPLAHYKYPEVIAWHPKSRLMIALGRLLPCELYCD